MPAALSFFRKYGSEEQTIGRNVADDRPWTLFEQKRNAMETKQNPPRPLPPSAAPPAAGEQLPLPLASRAVLLTPPQAADLLGVSARCLERWRRTGDGPPFVRLSTKSIRYRIEDLDAFVASSVRASTAQGASRR